MGGRALVTEWHLPLYQVLPYACTFGSLPWAGSGYPEKDHCPISCLWVKVWWPSELEWQRGLGYAFPLHSLVFHFSQSIFTCYVPDDLKFRAFVTSCLQFGGWAWSEEHSAGCTSWQKEFWDLQLIMWSLRDRLFLDIHIQTYRYRHRYIHVHMWFYKMLYKM